ncbi:hypothetical protein acdb102_34480 [Acidothermaceae bacterium B102]|nr:hypothetical protein acdb102_34480 [Acidothermaceae bacterium B102]
MDSAEAQLVQAIRDGDVAAVTRCLVDQPGLASQPVVAGGRTPLHVATDWPGYLPHAPEVVRALVDAGAPVDARTDGPRGETPLHWAASNDDADVAAVLIECGADVEAPGGSIGTPLDNAVGYGCWQVARLLVASGARVERVWQAAGLGLLARTAELVDAGASAAQVSEAFWHACRGGHRRIATLLLERGADMAYRPGYAGQQTLLEAVTEPDTRHDLLATWLQRAP